jgi:hypothetical protein
LARPVRNSSYSSALPRRRIERIAALDSSVVASMPIRLHYNIPRSENTPSTLANTSWRVSTSVHRRVREIVE